MRKRMKSILFTLFIFLILITGCSSKGAASPQSTASKADRGVMENVAKEEMAVAQDSAAPQDAPAGEVGISGQSSRKNTNQKMIYRANMSVEVTEKVEPLAISIQNFVETHNGYIEHMEQYRHGYDPVTQEQLEGVVMSIRIPHDHYKKTLQTISDLGVVVNKTSSADDVTLQYSDIESTLKMYKIEQERLLEMLQNKTADIKDMIEVEKRLSEVRVEIEKQESARRALDSLINYDTIQLEIMQVRRVSASVETKSFGTRIKSTFVKSVDEVVVFSQNLILAFTYMLIPISILVVIGVLIYIPISRVRRKKKKESMENKED